MIHPLRIPIRQQLINAGWGYASINPSSIQPDNGAGLTRGIIGLVNKGQPRKPDDWGSLRAWAWGAARGLDYLETDPAVDAKHVGIEGVSRYGKAALVTLAFEQRFAMALVGSSGKGGAALNRRNFGEAVESLTGTGEYHWMAGEVFKLLGVKDIGVSNNYKTEKMPPYNTSMLDGQLAWRQHDGGHTDAPNMKYFIQWADKNINHKPPVAP